MEFINTNPRENSKENSEIKCFLDILNNQFYRHHLKDMTVSDAQILLLQNSGLSK